MRPMDFFASACAASRNLHSRDMRGWCAVFLANALDSSQDRSFQRAAEMFRAASNEEGSRNFPYSGFREICDAYAEGEASENLFQCHAAACYLALYFKANRKSNRVRAWLQIATGKAVEVVGALGNTGSAAQGQLMTMIRQLEARENAFGSLQVSFSTPQNAISPIRDSGTAAAFFVSVHNRRAQQLFGRGSARYIIEASAHTSP